MNTYNFITKPFRSQTLTDISIRNAYALARQVELETTITTIDASLTALQQELFNLLKSPRIRFEVPVLGLNVISSDDFDGTPPCAMLYHEKLGLSAGKLVVIPDFTLSHGQGITTLRCWG